MYQTKTKICLLVGYYPINRGGAEYQTYLLSQRIKQKFDVFYISIGQKENGVFLEDGIKIYRLKSPPFNAYFLLGPKIIRILRKEKPALIYQRVGYSATGIAALFCKTPNTKLFWHIAHERDVLKFLDTDRSHVNIFNFLDKVLLEYGIKHADRIIAQTEYQNTLLHRNYKRKSNLILPNFHSLPTEKIEKSDKIQVLWIANWKPIKQPHLFLQLVKNLQVTRKASFLMLGRTDGFSWLSKELKNSGVKVMGEVSNEKVNELLAQSHILVNTSKQEGFSNTFIQAWMRSVPVVSLQVDPDNVLEKEGIGICSGNFEQLVEDTRRLIIDDTLRNQMGAKARTYAIENHSLKNMDKIIDLMVR